MSDYRTVGVMIVVVMTVGVLSVGVMTVGVMSVGVMTVGVLSRSNDIITIYVSMCCMS